MKACYAYVRVSTIKQGDGVSLEAQREAIAGYAQRHDLKVIDWFAEKETAAKSGRPIFNRMLKQLRQGKAQGLIMHKIDRSARNFADWAKIGDLADAGVEIFFATESLDFRSRGGRLTADIQAVIAADYIRNLREETKKGIVGRLKQGLYPFRAPLGYLDQGAGKPKVPDLVKAPLVKQLFERYAMGEESYHTLYMAMREAGLRNLAGGTVTIRGIETILNNPFYCGLMKVGGATYPGVHEPIITPSLFQAVQDVKAGRRVVKVRTQHEYIFRGLFRCQDCRTAMIAERQKGHVYYRCHTRGCVTKTVREEVLASSIGGTFQKLCIDPAQEARAKLFFQQQIKTQSAVQPDAPLRMELAKTTQRLERLTDALLDGLIDQEHYQTKREALQLEQLNLKEKLAARGHQKALSEQDLKNFLELVKSLCLSYKMAEPAEKRQLVKLTTSNRYVSGKNVVVEPQDWLREGVHLLCTPGGDPSQGSSRSRQNVTDEHVEKLYRLIHSFPARAVVSVIGGNNR